MYFRDINDNLVNLDRVSALHVSHPVGETRLVAHADGVDYILRRVQGTVDVADVAEDIVNATGGMFE